MVVDSRGRRILPGDVLVNKLGWEMKITETSGNIDICWVERVGLSFHILTESIAKGGWTKI